MLNRTFSVHFKRFLKAPTPPGPQCDNGLWEEIIIIGVLSEFYGVFRSYIGVFRSNIGVFRNNIGDLFQQDSDDFL